MYHRNVISEGQGGFSSLVRGLKHESVISLREAESSYLGEVLSDKRARNRHTGRLGPVSHKITIVTM